MQKIFRHLNVLWRIESAIAEARLRVLMRRSVLLALAGVVAVLGLGMLDVAAFLALQATWGPPWAAAIVGAGDVVLAALLALVAMTVKPGPELNVALEVRQTAVSGIETEISGLQEKFPRVFGGGRDAVDSTVLAVAVPLIGAIVRAVRKGKAASQ